MNIIYVSKACSNRYFYELFYFCKKRIQQQAQKFHWLMISGLAKLPNVKVTAVSDLPLTYSNLKRLYLKPNKDKENGVTFHYRPKFQVPIAGHFFTFIDVLIYLIKSCRSKKPDETIIICDILNLSIASAAKIAGMLLGIKTIGIVTDIPKFMKQNNSRSNIFKSIIINLYVIICSFFLRRHDFYVVLSKQMMEVVNVKKPFIIIEGLVDSNLERADIYSPENRDDLKKIIYAGALLEKYGVKKLIEAFIRIKNPNISLCLYGSGEMEKDIEEYKKIDKRIKYYGTVPNSEVVEEEKKATLLVNPRPSDEEFTKFSFPSKLMEYMVSGTPVLTTRLPSIPEEYYEHLLFFYDETIEGMTRTLNDVLNMPDEELKSKGQAAKRFVLTQKNNIIQAKRLVELISNYV